MSHLQHHLSEDLALFVALHDRWITIREAGLERSVAISRDSTVRTYSWVTRRPGDTAIIVICPLNRGKINETI